MHRLGPNCSMQYVIKGAIDAASSSEPMGLLPGMPVETGARHADATEFDRRRWGTAATAAMPRRQVASTSSSRLAYGPTRIRPPIWFKMMVRSGTALANAASSGSCGKYSHLSSDNPIRASTRAPARNWSLAS